MEVYSLQFSICSLFLFSALCVPAISCTGIRCMSSRQLAEYLKLHLIVPSEF